MRTFKPNSGPRRGRKKKSVFNYKPAYYGDSPGYRDFKTKRKNYMDYAEYLKRMPPKDV